MANEEHSNGYFKLALKDWLGIAAFMLVNFCSVVAVTWRASAQHERRFTILEEGQKTAKEDVKNVKEDVASSLAQVKTQVEAGRVEHKEQSKDMSHALDDLKKDLSEIKVSVKVEEQMRSLESKEKSK